MVQTRGWAGGGAVIPVTSVGLQQGSVQHVVLFHVPAPA